MVCFPCYPVDCRERRSGRDTDAKHVPNDGDDDVSIQNITTLLLLILLLCYSYTSSRLAWMDGRDVGGCDMSSWMRETAIYNLAALWGWLDGGELTKGEYADGLWTASSSVLTSISIDWR